MKRVGYFALSIILVLVAISLFYGISASSEAGKMNDYVNPQVNVSYLIPDGDGITIEEIVAEFLSHKGFTYSSRISAGQHGKKWAAKGMIKTLWENEDKYIDLSNLLNTECFNLRIYAESENKSKDIEGELIAKVSQSYPDYIKYDTLQCR